MSEIKDILALYNRASAEDRKLAFATVISTEGPSYRSAGARSLVIEDGTFGGGLSAGCLEGDIACRLDGNTVPFIVEYDLSEEDDIRGFPFGCGGTVQVFVEPLPNSGALIAVQWLSELNEPAVLLTVVKTEEATGFSTNVIKVGARFGISESGASLFSDGTCDDLLDVRRRRQVLHVLCNRHRRAQVQIRRQPDGRVPAVRHPLNVVLVRHPRDSPRLR